jgi:hypothetical protein
MIKRLITQLGIAGALSVISISAFAATVNANFNIASAQIVDLYSATFDGALSPCAGTEPDPDECTFFAGDQTPNPRNIAVSSAPASNATGTFNVDYDDVTGNILTVNSMILNMPDAVLTIQGTTIVTVTQGNSLPAVNDTLFIESGTGTLGRDLDGAGAGTALGQGTADAHQVRALAGSAAGLFEHDDAPNLDAPDFAVFADIVDSCTGGLCALIPILSLDGVRYRLLGTVSATGGDTLQLQTQTGNNSIYKVNLTTSVVPVPAAVWLFGSALGLLGWIRSRVRA